MKQKIKNSLVTSILFLLTIGLVLGAGAYRNIVSAESAQYQAKIPGKQNAPIVLDLGEQSLPKRLVQPGKVQISNGHGPAGVQNSSNKDLLVQVALKGFPSEVELELSGVEYDEKTFALKSALKPGQQFKTELIVKIPKKDRNKLIGISGEIQFIDQKSKNLLSNVPVYIVNSDYGDPYQELKIKPSEVNGAWGGHGKMGAKPGEKQGKPGENESGKTDGEVSKNENSKENDKAEEPCH